MLVAGLVLIAGSAGAAPGVLDPSFGDHGKVTTAFGGASDAATDVAIQPDGKIVVAGIGDGKIALARYTMGGALDPTFGAAGKVTTAVGRSSGASAVVLQPDGKIVVAGTTSDGTDNAFTLLRYAASGALDPTFGNDGIVTTGLGGGWASARALVLEPDGRLAVAGFANRDFAVVRYEADGSPDASFGNGGIATTAFGSGDNEDSARALVLQPDGKLVAAGLTDGGSGGGYDFALARYRSDGSLDPAFGAGGKVTTAIGPNHDIALALVLQPDGKLVAAGMSEMTSGTGFGLVRYERDGSLDTRFGTGGKTVTGSSGIAEALVRQPDGKLVAAGTSARRGSSDYDFALTRYNASGSVDTGFGKRGTVTTSFGSNFDAVIAVALQPDGRIVAVGGPSADSRESGFLMARYLGGEATCVVPRVTGTPLGQAKRAVAAAGCSVGTVRRAFSNAVQTGRVLSQKPKAGVKRAFRAKVALVVSKGPKKR